MCSARIRLQAVQNALTTIQAGTFVDGADFLLLPDGKRVKISGGPGTSDQHVLLDGKPVCCLCFSGRTAGLTLSGLGTPHEHTASHIQQYPVLEVRAMRASDQGINVLDMWAVIYALFTKYHEQETIPIILSAYITNAADLRSYILRSGLGRVSPSRDISQEYLFLMRATLWQGAGQAGFHEHGWLPPSDSSRCALSPFPSVQSFTRTPLVIAAHPLRPPKPKQGELLYKRYCPSVGQTLDSTYFDLGSGEGVSAHLEAFHRWQNNERVNKGWNESGSLEKHLKYVKGVMNDPAVLPMMMSWDGDLMGYAEIVWLKENHVATYIPNGPKDWDRGIHALVGEEKYRGSVRAQAWFRSVFHYCFLADPRTERAINEPRSDNASMIKVSIDAAMHIETIFNFPHRRSVMTCMPRERFFKMDVL
ncbi:acyl-CoA N-acyltransferase [Pisolithus thermaeus]|nr:acyl-CoA N-acyltransferase [Pisolithus thermaeus]